MTLKVTGKNIESGEAFQNYVTSKASAILQKYIGPELSGHVRVEKLRGRFRTAFSVRLRTGLLIEATGDAPDAYASADAALDRLEKRVRRYKRRLKSHHHGGDGRPSALETHVSDYTVRPDGMDDAEEAASEPSAPVIIAEGQRTLRQMPVSEAVMQLELIEDSFLVFRNAGNGEVNIVYRRGDGNIGWIAPGSGSENR
jgi:ribosomal subunit interface protein